MIRLKFYLPIRSTKKVDSDFADPIMLTQTMQANDSATHHRLQQHGWTTKGLADYIIEQKRGGNLCIPKKLAQNCFIQKECMQKLI